MRRNRWIVAVLVGCAWGGLFSSAHAEVMKVIADFSDMRVWPNPWRIDRDGSTPWMTFDRLPEGVPTTVRIFTVSGELIRSLSGVTSIPWDLRNGKGQKVASGVYLFIVTSGDHQKTGKLAIIR